MVRSAYEEAIWERDREKYEIKSDPDPRTLGYVGLSQDDEWRESYWMGWNDARRGNHGPGLARRKDAYEQGWHEGWSENCDIGLWCFGIAVIVVIAVGALVAFAHG